MCHGQDDTFDVYRKVAWNEYKKQQRNGERPSINQVSTIIQNHNVGDY